MPKTLTEGPHEPLHIKGQLAKGAQQTTLTTTLGCELGTAWGTMRPACGFRVARAEREDSVSYGIR